MWDKHSQCAFGQINSKGKQSTIGTKSDIPEKDRKRGWLRAGIVSATVHLTNAITCQG